MSASVAILGGGIAGLSAAHELAERGFDVTVYETRPIPGGKARSMPVPGSGFFSPTSSVPGRIRESEVLARKARYLPPRSTGV